MSVPTVSNEQRAERSPERHSERQQASSRSPSRNRRTTTSPSPENANESGFAARNGRRESTSYATNSQRPQNNTNGQYHQMESPSTYISSAHNRMGTVRYAEPSSGSFSNQGVSTTPINESNSQSWQRHFNEMPLQMFSSPDPITYQHLAPRLQPNRANSLPGTQISYSPMYPEKATATPQSAPQSYRPLPSFMPQSPYVTPRGTQPTLADTYSQQTYLQSTPVIPVNPYPSQPAADRKTDAFVASDPFHPHSLAKGEKDISSFDDIETPAPSRWGSTVPQGSTGGYVDQAVNYRWPDVRASDKPGGFGMPLSAPSAQGWVGGTGIPQDTNSPWRTAVYGSPYAMPASDFLPDSSQDPVNTQKSPMVGLNHGMTNGRYHSSDYTGYPTHSSGYARYPNQSWPYTGYPSNIPAQGSWYRPPADKKPTKANELSSRVSSWGTLLDHTPSAGYGSTYGTPAIPSPSGWGSDFEDDLPTSPTHVNEHERRKDFLKKKIEMPVPHVPQIVPNHIAASELYANPRASNVYVTDESTSLETTADPQSMTKSGLSQETSYGITIKPIRYAFRYHELSSLGSGDDVPATIVPNADSPGSYFSYLPDIVVAPPSRTPSDELFDVADENVTEFDNDNGQNSLGSESPGVIVIQPIAEPSLHGELPIVGSGEAPVVTKPYTDSPRSDFGDYPEIMVVPPSRPPSEEPFDDGDGHNTTEIPMNNGNDQNPPVLIYPGNRSYLFQQFASASASTPVLPSPPVMTMPIPQIPLIVSSNSFLEYRPVGPASKIASQNSPSESVSKVEPPYFPTKLYSPWNDPSNYPTVLPHASAHTSFWSKMKNIFRWPFGNDKLSTAKPQYAPNYIPSPYILPPHPPPPPAPIFVRYTKDSSVDMTKILVDFVTGTLPTQIYLHCLLRLPSLYFSRVARIFEEADLSLPEIKKMALETASNVKGPFDLQVFESSNVPLQYTRLKSTWEGFIDSVMREWKTFNIISVLLLSAILTILQIDSAADDPITRYTAIASLICALISLLFGCMYIIRFGGMRKTYKAAEWALEAKKSKTVIWWNVWVLLAMPAIWLTWSIVLYIACTMSFVWRTSSQSDAQPTVTSKTVLLTVRIVISSVLGLGLIYGGLILRTFSRYGSVMDKAWKKRVDDWIVEKYGLHGYGGQYMSAPHLGSSYYHTPYVRPSTNSLPPGSMPEYYTPYNRPTTNPFVPESVAHPFAYPVRGGTPYMPPTYLPFSTPFTPIIPPTNISSYGPYPPVIPPYSPPMTPFIPSIPSTPSTPFIPPLATPRTDPMDFPYGMPPMPANYSLRQNSAQRTYSGRPPSNNFRRDSGDNWNYSASRTRPSNEQSAASSDIDSVTRTNTQHNAGFSQNSQAPIDQPSVISNPPSTSRRYRRPSIFIPPPLPAELSPISAIEPVNNNGALQSVDTPSPAVQSPWDSPVEASGAHVRFRSPLQSAASNQEGFERIASPMNADDTSSSIIGTSSRRDD